MLVRTCEEKPRRVHVTARAPDLGFGEKVGQGCAMACSLKPPIGPLSTSCDENLLQPTIKERRSAMTAWVRGLARALLARDGR